MIWCAGFARDSGCPLCVFVCFLISQTRSPPRRSLLSLCFSRSHTAGSGKPFFRYLSAWFCFFAHRATIALEHHADRCTARYVHVLDEYVYVYKYSICIHVHIVCMHVYLCVFMRIYPPVCMYVRVCACACACVCASRVGYEWVEALGWTRKETKDGERADEWYYHWKSGKRESARVRAQGRASE